ncbi:MAG: carboxy-S-adenosyl-L-methionine synthase CmoA, partial [Syntrophotaleaceae bacterium]
MARDDIYSSPQGLAPFEFNERVAAVFDDMISRSVPGYRELVLRTAQLAAGFYRPGSCIYDLGCSNGNFGLAFGEEMGGRAFSMVAVDSSQPMLDLFGERLADCPWGDRIKLVCGDICEQSLADASVVVITLTLQFLPLATRDALLERIWRALRPGGVLLLAEKVVHADPDLDALQQDFYYRYKRERGYSELEISQKREALENVLIPETVEAHLERLRRAGFARHDLWFKWFNFAALL